MIRPLIQVKVQVKCYKKMKDDMTWWKKKYICGHGEYKNNEVIHYNLHPLDVRFRYKVVIRSLIDKGTGTQYNLNQENRMVCMEDVGIKK